LSDDVPVLIGGTSLRGVPGECTRNTPSSPASSASRVPDATSSEVLGSGSGAPIGVYTWTGKTPRT
jgi:hypothetical protein